MAAGKPFICTKKIGITEYVTDGKEVFIIPADNIASLTEKMDILLQNRKLRERMGQAAHETSLKFGWDNLAPEILRVYDHLINNHG
jgi:glycosyltransferase involved in cell wall biosynthesis